MNIGLCQLQTHVYSKIKNRTVKQNKMQLTLTTTRMALHTPFGVASIFLEHVKNTLGKRLGKITGSVG